MAEHPLKIFEKIDPQLLTLVQDTSALALADGALSRKSKLLMAMALDASQGAAEGGKIISWAGDEGGRYQRRDWGGHKDCPVHLRGG